jgi:hypothetical protein
MAGSGDLRRGMVFSGARTEEDRPARLLLFEPSYSLARKIERRINERFGQRPPVAQAMSNSSIEVRTPPDCADDPGRFIELVSHMYLDSSPGYLARQVRELEELATNGEGDLEHIGLCWEALGANYIPNLQPLYAHRDAQVAFFAARAGSRVGDQSALIPLGEMARGAVDRTLRIMAAQELAASPSIGAIPYLQPLANDSDQEIRCLAYEGLLKHRHKDVRTLTFAHRMDPRQTSFHLDIVESIGPPLVYVRRVKSPRVAVFGSRTPVFTPMFYAHPDNWVMMNAETSQSDLKLLGTFRGKLSPQLTIPPRLADLIRTLGELPQEINPGETHGLGLQYSRVVQILSDLSEQRAIPAPVILETASLSSLLGPERRMERPVTDDEAAGLVPTDEPVSPEQSEDRVPVDDIPMTPARENPDEQLGEPAGMEPR